MIRELSPDEAISTTTIGGACPYWTRLDGSTLIADTAEEIIDAIPPSSRVIDPIAVMGLLQFNYILGTRTLIRGVRKMPWRATLLGTGKLERLPPIRHGTEVGEARAVAKRLFGLLQQELREATAAAKPTRILLLLSGGFDSHVLAAVLKSIERDLHAPVECVTWSVPNSRDLVYAKEVAAIFDWKHHIVDYTPQLAWRNLQTAAEWGGAEGTGVHLHGLQWLEGCSKSDLVIAGTLGDSIGRGIYNGKHISRMTLSRIRNMHDLFRCPEFLRARPLLEADRATAWEGVSNPSVLEQVEYDMQENDLRRLLCHSMDYARSFCQLHQAFSSDPVVSLMWGLDVASRTDEVYFHLLRSANPRLISIPNPKMGRALDGTPVRDPTLSRSHHAWRDWAPGVLRGSLQTIYFSKGLQSLHLVYPSAMKRLWRVFLESQGSGLRPTEDVIKLCTIELARRRFDLRSPVRWGRSANLAERAFRVGLAPWMETSHTRNAARWVYHKIRRTEGAD